MITVKLLHRSEVDQCWEGRAAFHFRNPHIAVAAAWRPHSAIATEVDPQVAPWK
jgi:hypothetical protein